MSNPYEKPKQETQVDSETLVIMALITKGVIDAVGSFPLHHATKYIGGTNENFSHLTLDTTPKEIDNN